MVCTGRRPEECLVLRNRVTYMERTGSFYIVGRVGPGSGRVVESISTVKGHSAIPLDALLGSRLS
jgi:hypothetical protein